MPLDDDDTYARLTSDLAVEIGQGPLTLKLDAEGAIDLGATLIALGKQAASSSFHSWPSPAEQHPFLMIAQGAEDSVLNFYQLAELAEQAGEGWRFAWDLALAAVGADHGRAEADGWQLVVGRSRRLELALALLSWAEVRPDLSPVLEQEIAYLSSRELRERLHSL
jgi:hypothetical protein